MRYLLTLMLVFGVAGLAYGQNSAVILQTGSGYVAQISQTGAGDTAKVDQASSGYCAAYITQIGDDNKADVYWRNTSGYGGGNVEIIQEGNENEAYHRNFSFSPAYQNDKVYQYGDVNYAYQRYRYGTTPSGTAEIFQGKAGAPGSDNEAIQDALGGYLKISQYGNSNVARQRTESGSGYQKAYITQEGDNNDPDVSACNAYQFFDTSYDFDFEGSGNPKMVSQYQTGGLNEAYTNILGSSNHTAQWQEDGNNDADIKIGVVSGVASGENVARQVQLGGHNAAVIQIDGDRNLACQYQDGGHSSTIAIDGNDNLATVSQKP